MKRVHESCSSASSFLIVLQCRQLLSNTAAPRYPKAPLGMLNEADCWRDEALVRVDQVQQQLFYRPAAQTSC